MNNNLLINFWSKVNIRPPEECWEWMASKNKQGYGSFHVPQLGSVRSHRFIWEYYHGPINNPKIQVLHECDNPPCVNMFHLHLGDHKLNMKERKLRGRDPKHLGSSNPMSKLTEKDILEIRSLFGKKSDRAIAKMYHVCPANIHLIHEGKIWKHVGTGDELLLKFKRIGVRGSNHTNSKLTNEHVKWIRENSHKYKQITLAKMFNVSKTTICLVVNNRIYQNDRLF